MRANLAYVGAAAALAVEQQIENPAPFVSLASASRTRIAGIDVLTEDPLVGRRARLKAYQNDAGSLRNRLEEEGVSHLAILPTSAWNRIAENAELFRFQPKEDGSVLASMKPLEEAMKRANQAVDWPPLTMVGVGAVLGFAGIFGLATLLSELPMLANAGIALFGAGAGGYLAGLGAQMFFCDEDGKAHPIRLAQAEKRFLKETLTVPKEALLRMLFPAGEVNTAGVPIRIGLPPAPVEAEVNLRAAKAAGFELTLDTVAEAVTFEDDPLSAFMQHRESYWEQRKTAFKQQKEQRRQQREDDRRLFWSTMPDPIVTTSHGSATAIIVQYGEFPIEQAIIDRVLNSSDLV
jgi:hypothetical protein